MYSNLNYITKERGLEFDLSLPLLLFDRLHEQKQLRVAKVAVALDNTIGANICILQVMKYILSSLIWYMQAMTSIFINQYDIQYLVTIPIYHPIYNNKNRFSYLIFKFLRTTYKYARSKGGSMLCEYMCAYLCAL